MSKSKQFWFYVDKDLKDVTHDLEKVLSLPEYNWDYEDTWEWCEAKDENTKIYFDIAREHDWGEPIYSAPILLIIRREGRECSGDEIIDIGTKIAGTLGVDVHYGYILYLDDSKYQIDEELIIYSAKTE